jgi:protein SCO1
MLLYSKLEIGIMCVRNRYCLATFLIGALLLFPTGCKRQAGGSASVSARSSDSSVERYQLRGMVVSKSMQTNELTIQHGEIRGFMPAMTMVYKAKDAAVVQEVQPGDQITADVLVPSSNDNYLLSNVAITSKARRGLPPALLPAHQLLVGEQVPDLPLVNQDGKTIHLEDYRGKAVLITFIYTRCPMPTACPLITSHFARVNERLAKDPKAYADSHLISISLDPNYDKPPVLRQYGLAYLDDNAAAFSHWEFADTTPADLKKLAEAFGLEYSDEDNQITHSMRTTLIGPDSKVAQAWDGSGWEADDVVNAVTAAAYKAMR